MVRPLSKSYRLTPHVCAFVNRVWGTRIVSGNRSSPNRRVDYLCRYPYPGPADSKRPADRDKLPTSLLCDLIDEHGAENVLLLAQSARSRVASAEDNGSCSWHARACVC